MITIRLNNIDAYKKGVNYDTFIKSYFANFAFEGWPYITGGKGQFEGDQLILLDNLAGRNTKAIVLDGKNFSYLLSKHVMSGTLQSIKLATLGESYKTGGSFATDGVGHIVNVSAPVEITGLSIANGAGVKGEFHNLAAGLMGGVSDGTKADPSVLKAALASESIRFIGSAGSDIFTGARFSDNIRGGGGNDKLNGGLGNDRIHGETGKDVLFGGKGADILSGGASGDVFVFKTTSDSTTKKSGRDTISDFSQSQNDRVDLRSIDANANKGGNQVFTFIGEDGFHSRAGELRYEKAGKNTAIYGDTNGDGAADFSILLKGAINLAKDDFYL